MGKFRNRSSNTDAENLSNRDVILLPIYSFIIASAVAAVIYSFFKTLFKRDPWHPRSPKEANNNIPLFGVVDFFERRDVFFKNAGRRSKTGAFSFNVGSKPVIGITGEKGRAAHFESNNLNLGEGQTGLWGATPSVYGGKEEDTVGTAAFSSWLIKRLTYFLRTEQLEKGLPSFVNEASARLKAISAAPNGVIEPFDIVFKTVFSLNMRGVGCKDIADDPKWSDKCLHLIEVVENSYGASAAMFPWLPTFQKAKRLYASIRLYKYIKDIMDKREKTGKKEDDPLQSLMDDDSANVTKIVGFILSALFAGQLNTGHNTAVGAYYFARHPEWQKAARQEIEKVAAKYRNSADEPLVEQLRSIPLQAWENEFHVLEICLRETIRLQLMGSSIRRNISGKPVTLGDEVVQPGAFTVVQFAESHFDESIYPEPEKWEPDRYEPERAEDKKVTHGYVGWGSGRHPCTGMRFAKLEFKIVIAYLLGSFDLSGCDREGQPLKSSDPLPKIQWNALAARKPEERMYIKCTMKQKTT